MNRGFLMLVRGDMLAYLLARDHKALILLTQIAERARYHSDPSPDGLNFGQAWIGDWRSLGMSEKEYRGAKGRLQKLGLVGFRGGKRGTIATLLDSRVYCLSDQRSREEKGRTKGVRREAKFTSDDSPDLSVGGQELGEEKATNHKRKKEKGGETFESFSPLSLSESERETLAKRLELSSAGVDQVLSEFNYHKREFPGDPRDVHAFLAWATSRKLGKEAVLRAQKEAAASRRPIDIEPKGWREWMRVKRPTCDYHKLPWDKLSQAARDGIRDQMANDPLN